MVFEERVKTRETRKRNILATFLEKDEMLYTNEVAKAINVAWPTTDQLLQELVEEKQLAGGKMVGYTLRWRTKMSMKLKKLMGDKHEHKEY